jgi:hypothetical protein
MNALIPLGARKKNASQHDWDSHRLWNLWEMIEKYGALFASAISILSEAKWMCAPFQLPEGQQPVSREAINQVALAGIAATRRACILADMDSVLPELDRLTNAIIPIAPGAPVSDNAGVAAGIKHLISRVKDELQDQFYYRVGGHDVPLYIGPNLFGTKVSDKFDLAGEDIDEAGKCLALGRPTACVFHLMRVMEIGVQAFGKKLKIKIDVKTEAWHQIMTHVTNAINGSASAKIPPMPSQTEAQKRKKSQYAEAAAHLQSVRLAWRNEVMHPKRTYTQQEAHDVFNATRVFMAHLAGLL